MKIVVASIFVDDQEKALQFYTQILGFQKKTEIVFGEHRWLTVVSPEQTNGVELVLEPNSHPAVPPFQEALLADGIPWTSFAVTNIEAEYERLTAQGVEFTQPPMDMGGLITAVFHDTCGNLIQLAQR